jgi:tRNA1Val (adenine37-N6)-methyltransferase
MAFRFRQFTIEDRQSTLRVGTDAMLLGSWANPKHAKRILDIGTGCGVLALMMAQKSIAVIDAIDIDQPSIIEANKNFKSSPWASSISAIQDSLRAFSQAGQPVYDFIITNPPYFSNSLRSPSSRANHARHDDSLSLTDIASNVRHLLHDHGCFAIILPCEPADGFQAICAAFGLYPSRSLVVYPKPASSPKRTLMEFTKTKIHHPEYTSLTILDASGKFTPEYLSLTKDFHSF